MDIANLKELDALLKLCRKRGVTEIDLGIVKLKMGDLPAEERAISGPEVDADNPYANFPQGELTPEQLMFYSSGGLPEDDPTLNGAKQ